MRLPRLRPEDTGLLVVDIQERFAPVIYEIDRVIDETLVAIRVARELAMPIFVTEQYPKGLGNTMPELIEELGSDFHPLEKMVFSAIGADGLAQGLEYADVKSVLVVGIEAHVCVLQTTHDLLDAGYAVFPVVDAISSRHPSDAALAFERMRHMGATLVSTEMLVFELLQTAKHPKFKALQALIK